VFGNNREPKGKLSRRCPRGGERKKKKERKSKGRDPGISQASPNEKRKTFFDAVRREKKEERGEELGVLGGGEPGV